MKKRILIIDDNQDILELTEFLLNEKGFEVIASSTPHILSELSQINPDLILLDEHLDGIKGHEQCIILKSSETTKHIPVVLLSAAFGIEKIAKDCLADGFINKPFDIDYLNEVVENQLLITSHTNNY
jgi:CheY-like chemotaxis protein